METKKVILKATDGTELMVTITAPHVVNPCITKVEEINPDLIKEAKRRGYIAGVKIHPVGHSNFTYTIVGSFYEIGDSLHFRADEKEWDGQCSNPAIYKEGIWAEIIPDKKKLPETKKEFGKFISDYSLWREAYENDGKGYKDFLNEYED